MKNCLKYFAWFNVLSLSLALVDEVIHDEDEHETANIT